MAVASSDDTSPTGRLLRELGLHRITVTELTIQRRRNGRGFIYINGRGRPVRDRRIIYRLERLAVPPAYEDVVFAADAQAHLQALGRDSAGRRQYRYHPDWEKVRELRKARRLASLADALDQIRAWTARQLRTHEPTKDFTLAAAINLVALTGLRPGSETYAQQNGTRGATTLLKSNVTINGRRITLRFRAKGGKSVEKEVVSQRLGRALKALNELPGRRLFQYRADDGSICVLRRRDVNAGLRAITGRKITLKDFRTLNGSAQALEELAAIEPVQSERGRRRQILATMRRVSETLANTPAICRKSYVHAAVVSAFESGALQKIARKRNGQSSVRLEKMLMDVLARFATCQPSPTGKMPAH